MTCRLLPRNAHEGVNAKKVLSWGMIKANLLGWGFPDSPKSTRHQAQPESIKATRSEDAMWLGTMAFSEVTTMYRRQVTKIGTCLRLKKLGKGSILLMFFISLKRESSFRELRNILEELWSYPSLIWETYQDLSFIYISVR